MNETPDPTDLTEALFEHRSKFVLTLLEASSKMIGDIIRTLFLFNGGALVALLALMGALARNSVSFPEGVSVLVLWFGAGLGFSILTTFLAWAYIDLLAAIENQALQNGTVSPSLSHTPDQVTGPGIAIGLAALSVIASAGCGIIGMLQSAEILSKIAST